MKKLFFLILLLGVLSKPSTKEDPSPLASFVQFETAEPTFQTELYFSLDNIPEKLKNNQWYAFVSWELPQKNFNEDFQYTYKTISKDGYVQSDEKQKCMSTGNHYSDCFISNTQVDDVQKYLLKITVSFFVAVKGKIKVDVYGVRSLNIHETIRLQRNKENYSRIARIDIRKFQQSFRTLVCSLKKLVPETDEEMYYFLVSNEETPPDFQRKLSNSHSIFGEGRQIILKYKDIQEADYLTFSFELMDDHPFEFKCGTNRKQNQTVELLVGKPLNELIDYTTTYHISLPPRDAQILYCIYLQKIFSVGDIRIELFLDEKRVTEQEINEKGKDLDITVLAGRASIWINSTVNDVKLVVRVFNNNSLAATTVGVEKIDSQFIQLPEYLIWIDRISPNSSQYLYINFNLKDPDEKINFDILVDNTREVNLTVMNCVDFSPQKCQADIYSNNSLTHDIALPIIPYKRYNYPEKYFYTFRDIILSSIQQADNYYRALVVIQIKALADDDTVYSIFWRMESTVKKLVEGQIFHGVLIEDHLQVFEFQVLEVGNFSFARVDYFCEGRMEVYGTDELVNSSNLERLRTQKHIYSSYDKAIVFNKLKSSTKYYVYFYANSRTMTYRVRLTMGSYTDASQEHIITRLHIGQQSKNTVVLQPTQILLLEIKVKTYSFYHIQSSMITKMCYFHQIPEPSGHQDMLEDNQCAPNRQQFGKIYKDGPQDIYNDYFAIQNKQKVPVEVKITTQKQQQKCSISQLGDRYSIFIDQTNRQGCVRFQVSHKGEMQISTNIEDPLLKGVAHPTVHIGQLIFNQKQKLSLTTSTRIFTAEQIDDACSSNYQYCFIEITISGVEGVEIGEHSINVFAGYTDHPLELMDGVSQWGSIKQQGQKKHYKYATTLLTTINLSVRNSFLQVYEIYAKIITVDQRFIYPSVEEYNQNSTDPKIYHSTYNSMAQQTHLTISSQQLNKHCSNTTQCYVLILVVNKLKNDGKYTIQCTQTTHKLTLNTSIQTFQQKDQSQYYIFYNDINEQSLNVIISSHGHLCHKTKVSKGLDPFENQVYLGQSSQIVSFIADKGDYTITIESTDDCYYTIRVIPAQKGIIQLKEGYSHPIYLNASQKAYFFLRNQDKPMIKVISAISKQRMGQIIFRAMPIKSQQLTDYMMMINGQAKRGMDYVWTDKNHLSIYESDSKYCKKCYICIEIEAVQDVLAYISQATSQIESIAMLYSSVLNDILLENQTISYIFKYRRAYQHFEIIVQVGSLTIELYEDDKLLSQSNLTYNKSPESNNTLIIHGNEDEKSNNGQMKYGQSNKYYKLKIKALQNTDYTLDVIRGDDIDTNNTVKVYHAQAGRPKNFLLSEQETNCFNGTISNSNREFILTIKDNQVKGTKTNDVLAANKVVSTLEVSSFLNNEPQNMTMQQNQNLIFLKFTQKEELSNNNFKICFKSKENIKYWVTFLFVGNLNYLHQNEPIHIKGQTNLTFMSQGTGRGIIEVDECSSRASIVLSRKYHNLKSSTSDIKQRRQGNNVWFNHKGPVYVRIQSADALTLKWRNEHFDTKNGYGYQFFSPSTFRIHQSSLDSEISLNIFPLKISTDSDQKQIPQIKSLRYRIIMAAEESDLYNAMNCQKGKYMEWIADVYSNEITQEKNISLNTIKDIRMYFRQAEYILLIIKAQLAIQWKSNNQLQEYRFYYPYQEYIVNPIINEPEAHQKQSSNEDSSLIVELLTAIIILLVLVVAALTGLKLYRKYYRVPGALIEEELANKSSSIGVELQSGSYKD